MFLTKFAPETLLLVLCLFQQKERDNAEVSTEEVVRGEVASEHG